MPEYITKHVPDIYGPCVTVIKYSRDREPHLECVVPLAATNGQRKKKCHVWRLPESAIHHCVTEWDRIPTESKLPILYMDYVLTNYPNLPVGMVINIPHDVRLAMVDRSRRMDPEHRRQTTVG